jgi:stage II sporulation protein D
MKVENRFATLGDPRPAERRTGSPSVTRRAVLLAIVVLLLAAGTAAARGKAPVCSTGCTAAPAGSGPLFVVTGHGWGHGVGMSQYGAYGFAQHGWTYDQILAHYFPGTSLGTAPVARARVLLADGRKALTVASAAPFRVKDGTGAVQQLPAGSYSFGPGLKLKVGDAEPVLLTPPLTFSPGATPLQLGKLYRGSIEVDVVDGKLRAVNVVGLEQYLYGVVPSEMPSTWAPEALEAQAVAARSYALATRKVAAPFDLYADTRSQVYGGIAAEKPSTTAAVDATAGQVVLWNGAVADTFFFSTSGGRTANASDVFNGQPTPYLVAVDDPYDAISPYHDWGPFPYTGRKLASALHVPGPVTDARIALNASGRVAALQLLEAQGEVDVAATKVRRALGLRSTWFDVGVLSLTRPAPARAVEYGTQVVLDGLARGVAGVALEQRPTGTSWQAVGPVAADAAGTVALTQKPSVTTDYRLATASVAAAPVRVAVMPRIRFAATQLPGSLQGLVRPVLTGAGVQIQRQDAATARWTTIATTTVDASGRFSAPLQLTPGTYRARIAASRGYAAGTTPPLRVVSP